MQESGKTLTDKKPMRIDLTYLKEMSAGNYDLVKEMVAIFNEQAVEFRVNMQRFLAEGDWLNLGKTAHKAKASISIMGLHDLAAKLKALELDSKEGKNTDRYAETVDEFLTACDDISRELDEVLRNFSSYF